MVRTVRTVTRPIKCSIHAADRSDRPTAAGTFVVGGSDRAATLRVVRELLGWPVRSIDLLSPHSPQECQRRLAAVTSRRGAIRFLRQDSVGRPDPRFQGTVTASSMSIVRFMEPSRRQFLLFPAWLRADLIPGADGSTEIRGRILLRSRTVSFGRIAVGTPILLGMEIVGIVEIASGRAGAGTVFALVPIAMAALIIASSRRGLLDLRDSAAWLLQQVGDLLDIAR
jgi:hypothetical protein